MENRSDDLQEKYEQALVELETLRQENAELRAREARSRALEREVSEREKRLQLILNQLPAVMWTCDTELRFTSVGGAGLAILGLPPEQIIGATVHEIATGSHNEHTLIYHQRALQGESQEFEASFGERTFQVYLEPLRFENDEIEGFIGLGLDITDLKRLRAQVEQSQRLESIGRIAGGIAHDFNNILAGINGFAELALMHLPENHPSRDPLKHILDSVERSGELVSQLLAFARRRLIAPQPMNLNEHLQRWLPLLQRLIGEDIELKCFLADDLGLVRADPTQIEQVLLNLATNARQAMPTGGVLTIETQNVVLDETYAHTHWQVQPGNYILLSVTDTGHGIAPEHLPHLFEPFYTTREGGTGLGLATVHGIINQAKGHIWVYSEVGKGTTFKIYLPRLESDLNQPMQGGSPMTSNETQAKGTLLLVEDNPDVRESTTQLLQASGYTVYSAENPEQAIQLAQTHRPDLLITDVILPQMRGSELAEQLQTLYPDLKVLFISGYTENSVVIQGEVKPGVEFLPKPFTLKQLLERIHKLLGEDD